MAYRYKLPAKSVIKPVAAMGGNHTAFNVRGGQLEALQTQLQPVMNFPFNYLPQIPSEGMLRWIVELLFKVVMGLYAFYAYGGQLSLSPLLAGVVGFSLPRLYFLYAYGMPMLRRFM